MPSPIGHALAGLAVAWMADAAAPVPPDANSGAPRRKFDRWALPAACVALAVAPDVDVLFGSHRTVSHSVGAVAITWFAAALVARATRMSVLKVANTCAAAVASHVLLDWLGRDTSVPIGIQALWPFSQRYFQSGADVFLEISRRYWKPDEFIWGNLRSIAREVAILGPVAAAAWWTGRRRTARVTRQGRPWA